MMSTQEARRAARLLAYSHGTVDFYQGAVAALVPFFVLERGYGYATAAGIVLASSLASSIVQPLFGWLGDRRTMRWLIPVSVFLSGAGIAAIAVSGAFWITAIFAMISSIGIAAFHPAGARRAREISGDDHVVMSWFALGGKIGFAAAPIFVVGTIGPLSLSATWLLALPAMTGIVALIFIGNPEGTTENAERLERARTTGRNDWRSFSLMTAAIMCRSVVHGGLTAFLILFMTEQAGLGALGGTTALFLYYLGGIFGATWGGHLARRWSRSVVMPWAYAASAPMLAALILIPGPLALLFVLMSSILLAVPFSLHVSLGQDHLPRNIGTASGVTLGLAVSVGGISAPLIGSIGDDYGLQLALLPLIALPVVAALLLISVKDPLVNHRANNPQVSPQPD